MGCEWSDKIFNTPANQFESLALEVFDWQCQHNTLYRQFVEALNVAPQKVRHLTQIPFMPIRFFKSHAVQATQFVPQLVFESSGTTQTINSRHLVKDAGLYENSFTRGFEKFYGPITDWVILGLLPNYLERGNSSLVYMVDRLIKQSGQPESGFYLYDEEGLARQLQELELQHKKTLLIGVTYALVDFAQHFPMPLHHTVIMETGGMKGRKKEMIREELHQMLQTAFHLPAIHAEYGMTELLSQAYSSGNGLYHCPPWMKVMVREDDDPLSVATRGSGVMNIIDLGNIYSCAFIATDDAGIVHEDGSFEIRGRTDGSDLRGCSLLTTAI